MDVSRTRAAIAGAASAALGLATAVLVAALIPGGRSPLLSVGDIVVDLSPPAVKDWAIETFGAADKAVLYWSMVVTIVLVGAVAGLVARRSRSLAAVLIGLGGVVGVAAALRDPLSEPVPTIVGVVAGVVAALGALWFLLRMAEGPASAAARGTADGPASEAESVQAAVTSAVRDDGAEPLDDVTRRRFLVAAGATAGLAVATGLVGRSLTTRLTAIADRADITIPSPADMAGPVPAGLPGAPTPLIVRAGDFYTVDTALSVPMVTLDSWRLEVTGLVDTPYTLSYEELLGLPMIERHITIACVSNRVGGPYVGNATWQGVPLARILERAGVRPEGTQLVGRSVDEFTAGFPTEAAIDGRDAMVAVAMNGEPLPPEHGFPARLIVPGLYGYVSATKWLREIELTTWDGFDAYWVPRGWAKEAPVKTQSRIDRPGNADTVTAGAYTFAGVAWAPTRGIEQVEIRVDGGDWVDCELSESMSDDAWRQWSTTLDVAPGDHTVEVRATDGSGETQSAEEVPARPDGAEGYHTVAFTAA